MSETRIDQGMKEANPMTSVMFFQTRDEEMGDAAFPMQQHDISMMFGSVFLVSRACPAALLVKAMMLAKLCCGVFGLKVHVRAY